MNKQDEEKAKELYYYHCNEKSCGGFNDCKNCPKSKADEPLLKMAAWKEQQMIEKACNWIKENKHKYIKLHSMKLMVDDSIIEDLKKYMEENYD